VPYPEIVNTPRLALRRLRFGDEQAFVTIWSDPDVWNALRPGRRFDPEHGPRRFQHHLQHWEKHGFGVWLIEDPAAGDVAGWVGSSHPDFVPRLADEVEIAWSLRRQWRGKGIATEGARAALSAALEHLRPARLISLIDQNNHKSAAVAKRLGMRAGELVEHDELDLQLRVYVFEAPYRPGVR
jgi:RimJ/RimL family protein N-acetyltransferase